MKTVKTGTDKIIFSSGDQYYDDCPICKAMQKAEKEDKGLDPIELAKAFGKAKKMETVIGNLLDNARHD